MNMTDLMKEICNLELDDFNTMYIAKVANVYNENEKVDIVPLEFGKNTQGINVIKNVITEVPVMQIRNGNFAISSKHNIGDIVFVACCFHPAKKFLKFKTFVENEQKRLNRARKTNSIVIGGLATQQDQKVQTDGLIIKNLLTQSYMEFKKDGTIEILGEVNVIGDVKSNGVSLSLHTHTDSTGSPTSPPIPTGGV